MRPRQWTKNLLVFAALTFDLKLDDPGRVLDFIRSILCPVSVERRCLSGE